MLGLGNYDSSSEDEVEGKQPLESKVYIPATSGQPTVRETVLDREPSGPVLGPMHEGTESPRTSNGQPSTYRALIHELTLPPVPNLDIPPSPPGSPKSSANVKFAHFLSLKKQDIHFNDKLAGSVSLKNPSLLRKMMEHAGIDDQVQYSSSLTPDLWNIPELPSWGYKEELLRAQRELNAKADEGRLKGHRDAIEFLPSTMNHFPGTWGRPRDDVYGPYDSSFLQTTGPKTHTQSPAVTGTSVLAVKFNGGVAIAADNLASYGSLARFTDVKRLRVFADAAVIGFSGDVSDMQYIDRLLESMDIKENYSAHGNQLNAKNVHTYLSKIFYKRRSEFNPLWNHILVAGFDSDKKPFLSSADLLGTTFSAPHLATGFGAHLAIPILRRLFPEERRIEDVSKEDAVAALKDCLKVLWYRDARSLDKYSLALITQDGIEVHEDQQVEAQSWAFAESIKGYGAQAV
ncbi:nucleophile aminohydrolase [Aspergillus aurantiobrunneus]